MGEGEVWWGNVTKTEHLAELGIDGRIKRVLKEIGWLRAKCNDMAQDTDKWKTFVKAAMNNRVFYDAVNFPTN